MRNNIKKGNTRRTGGVSFVENKRQIVVHKSRSNIFIYKSDMELYLRHYKDAIENKKDKKYFFVKIIELLFIFSIFFTANFKSFLINGQYIKYIYLIFATIISVLYIQKFFKKDDSKFGVIDPEKMANIIENNCDKNKK